MSYKTTMEVTVEIKGDFVKGCPETRDDPGESDTFENIQAFHNGVELDLSEDEEHLAILELLEGYSDYRDSMEADAKERD